MNNHNQEQDSGRGLTRLGEFPERDGRNAVAYADEGSNPSLAPVLNKKIEEVKKDIKRCN